MLVCSELAAGWSRHNPERLSGSWISLQRGSQNTFPVLPGIQSFTVIICWRTWSPQFRVQTCSRQPRFLVIWVDELQNNQEKFEKTTFYSSGCLCWFSDLMLFCCTTVLLMRRQRLAVQLKIFCNWSNFCHPSGLYLPRVKKKIIIIMCL